MGKIVLEIEEFGKTYSEYKIFDQDCIRIGRAFNNDLIIKDPFVSAVHLSLNFAEGKWDCISNISLNGTVISSLGDVITKIDADKPYPVSSGDTILLGKTSIHVWDIDQPVIPEQVLDRSSTLIFDPRKTRQSLIFNLGVVSFIYCLYLSQWFWKSNNLLTQIIIGLCGFLICLVIWASVWALITRFTKRQHRFLQHLIFSFQWAVISIAGSVALKYVFFFMCNYGFYYVVSLFTFGLFSTYILNNHLNIGTNLSFIKRILISGLISFIIILLSVLSYYATHNEFNPNPHHFINIVPVGKQFIPSIPIDEEIKRLDSIF